MRKLQPLLWLILLHLVLTGSSAAQQHVLTTYTSRDGLVSNHIRRIFQDSKGFLWFITQEGISKYDGHRFTNYNTHNGLSHSFVNDFYETKDGKIYVACNDGSIDVIKGSTISSVVKSKIIPNRFFSFPGGSIVITTDENGLYEFRNEKLVKPHQSFPDRSYGELIWLNDSLFMAASKNTLDVFNKNYDCVASLTEKDPVFEERKIYIDSHQRIWFCSYNGLKQIIYTGQKDKPIQFTPLPAIFDIPLLQTGMVNEIYEDGTGTFWIATIEGIVKINPDGSVRVLKDKDGLSSELINDIFQDREKNLWFGTFLGISKLVTQPDIRVFGTGNGLLTNHLYFIHPFKKEYLLIGTAKGLQLFNSSKKKFTRVRNTGEKNLWGIVPNTQTLQVFSWKEILSFDTTLLEVIEKESPHFKNTYFGYLTRDKNGHYFWGGYNRVFFLSDKPGPSEEVLDLRPTCLLIDKKEYLWVGTWQNGLYRFRYEVNDGKLKILSKENYLADESIRSLFEDSKGNIWAGTRYNGVYRIKNGEKVFTDLHFDQSNGLMSNWITGIRETSTGNIMLAFPQGLDKLIKKDSGYLVFNFSKIYNFFSSIISLEYDKDDILWLGTIDDGIVEIATEKTEIQAPLPVYITNIVSSDSVYSPANNTLNLGYRHKQLQFEFSSPGFVNEKQLLYSYRLLGSNNTDWSQPSNDHSVSYANLQPGDYSFEVRNLGWNNEWGPPATFSFTISPPFWQTWLFRFACLLVIVSIAIWLVKRRIKNIRHEAAMKQKMTETEMTALRSQMNPHFIFNCLNAIDNLIQTNQKDKATVYLSRFAKLVRNVLDSSKNNVVPFHKDYESLQLYLQMEQFRCNNRFEYELNVDDELLHGDFRVPPLIIQPFVENAIHHGLLNKETNDRKLTVEAGLDKDTIRYTITDNGIGRTKAEQLKQINKPEHISYGIQITKERIHLYNLENKSTDDVTITDLYKDNEPFGTSVVIRLKITDDK